MQHQPAIADFDDPTFNPFILNDQAFGDITDTYERIAALRAQASVHKGNILTLLGVREDANLANVPHYSVFGRKEVLEVLNSPSTFSNDVFKESVGLSYGASLSTLNPPVHTRYRKIFQRAFLPDIIIKWGDAIVTPVINEIIDKFQGRGRADLVAEFARQYPFQIIFRQLGLPAADIKIFHKLTTAVTIIHNEFMPFAQEAGRKLGDYFARMIDDRRRNPGADDLVEFLINAEADGEGLSDELIISFLRQLINAAGDTTYHGTGTLFMALLTNPGQYRAVVRDRTLLPNAIEEALRWEGPIASTFRTATCDCWLGGVEIPAGAIVDVCLGSVNRDPEVFPNPDRFDIFRERKGHFTFGGGPHVCIGRHLARLELHRAANAIMDRLPNLRMDEDKPAAVIRGGVMRMPRTLFVRFDR